jgi:hypothetical protein
MSGRWDCATRHSAEVDKFVKVASHRPSKRRSDRPETDAGIGGERHEGDPNS